MTPPVGTPMAGYGARRGAASTGVHDDLYVKAVAFSDGVDTAVIVAPARAVPAIIEDCGEAGVGADRAVGEAALALAGDGVQLLVDR